MTTQNIIDTAKARLSSGQAREAMEAIDRGLIAAPEHPELLQLKAAASWQAGDLYGADDALRALIKANGGDTPATDLMVAQLALDLLEFDRSRAAIDRLLGGTTSISKTAPVAVRLLVWQGDTARALSILEQGLKAQPDDPVLLALAVAHDPDLTADLRAHAEALAETLPAQHPQKTSLLYPLARDQDRRGDYQRAWKLMTTANTLSAARSGIRFDTSRRAGLKTLLVKRAMQALKHAACLAPAASEPDRNYAYLVGAPRTGSSLLQSILAAHDGVQSAGERGALLPYLNDLCDRPNATPAQDFLTQVQAADRSGLDRARLTSETLVDKTTHNIFIAPLIASIHPGARFVNVTRRPHDIAMSMLFHDFPPAFPEACDLGAIIAVLQARHEIAELYADQDLHVLHFDFDAFTGTPEIQGERLAKALGLEWQPGTLDPANRIAAVPTFSAGQVRKPIASISADKWRRFEAFLSPQDLAALAILDR